MNKELSADTTLSHYRIVSKIGAGGMGEVYLAQDTKLERQVALKVLLDEVAGDEDRVKRFVQEAKAASALNHPNILTVYEIGEFEHSRYIATELIKGETLRDRLRGEPMTLREVLDVAMQVAAALNAAHGAGIVHRDIKPENIMLRDDGIVKVLDFGLAKLAATPVGPADSEDATRAQVNTRPGVVMGTVIYMSPEQARGKETDARCDVWSLGVVMYEMLARATPFAGETANDSIAAILTKEPPPLDDATPSELRRIVRKSLQKQTDERYQTVKDLLLDVKNLKRELEFSEELERSNLPQSTGSSNVGTAQMSESATATLGVPSLDGSLAASTMPPKGGTQNLSSAEYIVSEIKSHKFGVAAILVVVLAAIIGGGYWFFGNRGSAVMQISSIAVMPFVNESGNADVEYLSDGMTETLIGSLTQLSNLNVKARSSVFRYKGKETDAKTIGKELNVQAILNGRVVQRGEQLTLSLELVDAANENAIWSQQYTRKQSDLVSLQSEIARDVSGKLRVKLSGADEKKLRKTYTSNSEAYQLYLRGRHEWNKFSFDGLTRSIPFFERSIKIDPNYALAYSGLADSYLNLGVDYLPPKETMPQARIAALQAIALDDSLAEAHSSLGSYKLFFEWDTFGAEHEYLKAIDLAPNYANAHHFYSHCLQFSGREADAIREMKTAVELEPLSAVNNAELAWAYYLARQYEASIEQSRKTLELEPGFAYAYFTIGQAYSAKGMYAEALTALEKGEILSPGWLELQGQLAYTHASAGDRKQAHAMLTKVLKKAVGGYINEVTVASVYAALGDNDQAMAWLERGYQERCSWMKWISIEPRLDKLRPDPRFQDLVRRLGT